MNIIYENEQFIVINKPAGMLSIPDRKQSEPSLKDRLKEKYGNIYTVHRLDKGTSGVIVFAKDEESHKQLSQLFEGRDVVKKYMGLVHGAVSPATGTIEAAIAEHPAKNGRMITHIKGKTSITDYEVLESFRLFTWVAFQIHTGRTHQIRVHMKHIGHTLFNDWEYGGDKILKGTIYTKYKQFVDNCFTVCPRCALHAKTLGFKHPRTGEEVFFESPLPNDIGQVVEKWRNYVHHKIVE